MRFTQCIAAKTGVLENKIINFDNALTIIYGGNESGKSLFAKAMIDSAFGVEKENRILPEDMWGNLYVNMTLSDENEKITIIRNGNSLITFADISSGTGKEIYAGETDLIKLSDKIKTSPELSNSAICRLITKMNPKIFIDASFVSSPFESFIEPYYSYDNIRKIISFSENNFIDIHSKLKRSIYSEKISSRINNSFLSNIFYHENEIQKIKKELQIFDVHFSKIDKLSQELSEIEEHNTRIENEISELESNNTFLHKSQEALANVFIIESKLNGLKNFVAAEENKVSEIETKKQKLSDRFSKFINLSEIQRNNLNNVQLAYKYAIDAKDSYSKRLKTIGIIKTLCYTVTASFFCASLAFPAAMHFFHQNLEQIKTLYKILIPSSGLFLSIVSITILRFRMKRDISIKLEELYNQRVAELKDILSKSDIVVSSEHFEDMFEFLLQYFEEYSEFLENEIEIEDIENSLFPEEKINTVRKEISELEDNRSSLLKSLENINGERNSKNTAINKQIEGNAERISDLKNELERNNEILRRMNEELHARGKESSQSDSLNQKKLFHEQKLKSLKSSHKSASFILTNMTQARVEFENRSFSQISEETYSIFSKISTSSSVTRQDTDLMIKGDMSSIKNTSLRYSALLSFKLAMGRAMKNSNFSLPLIIDEPAAYLDKGKIDIFFSILSEFSSERQIIILTCDDKLFSGIGQTVKF
ncbi:MAG: AAA family ATPase [Spirochaetes bacterium]|nr:AAA family ATPase [Spirochaetota bacterium]